MAARDAVIAETPLRSGEVLRVSVNDYRGQRYVHVRRYYDDAGTWKPGKGAAFRLHLLPWVLAALRTLEQEALRTGELLPEDYENEGLPAPESP